MESYRTKAEIQPQPKTNDLEKKKPTQNQAFSGRRIKSLEAKKKVYISTTTTTYNECDFLPPQTMEEKLFDLDRISTIHSEFLCSKIRKKSFFHSSKQTLSMMYNFTSSIFFSCFFFLIKQKV